ncbi:hypothetical protein HAPAU_07210 [Halalkalicoccus paucihalophilus]|uniref:Uncharacterized protein n=1 Tax=Halalkalicoccus paucihalophilus TaxID=1008153 RepID=A0A151AHX2_9EURY|nr:hypothetical protein [Halalkalicoccus paucihalophilus]KYH27268.1 hypothetical protein HAPAU_07210 [Halalkalicoccus paucihalophilus]
MQDTPDETATSTSHEPDDRTASPRTKGLSASRRRVLRGAGAAAGLVGVFGGTRPTTAAETESDSIEDTLCTDSETETDPDELYLGLLAKQLELRATTGPNLDEEGIRTVLEEYEPDFEGHLIFFAASDFGKPRVFLPDGLPDRQLALETILDRVHQGKWNPDHAGLREVRNRVFEEVRGIHQGLPAVYHDEGEATYDLTGPWDGVYNFVTIRQVVGLVDWVTNADEEWTDGRRLTYGSSDPMLSPAGVVMRRQREGPR